MRYVEIAQDIVDAIKGGANYTGETESEEIVVTINDFGGNFAEVIKVVMDFFWEFVEAVKKYF